MLLWQQLLQTVNQKLTNCRPSWGKHMVKVWCKSMHGFKFWIFETQKTLKCCYGNICGDSNPKLRNHRSSKGKPMLKIWSYWDNHVFDLLVWPCLEMTFYQCLQASFTCHCWSNDMGPPLERSSKSLCIPPPSGIKRGMIEFLSHL